MARSEHLPVGAIGLPIPGAVDLSELSALSDSGEFARGTGDFVEEVIALFLQLTPKLLETAESAVQARDGESLARACHKLHSQAAFLSARPLMAVCRRLESLGHARQMGRAAALLGQLEDELDRVHAALQLHRAG